METKSFLYLILAFVSVEGESYIPTYIEGVPVSGQVISIEEPDLRKASLFRIEHQVLLQNKFASYYFPVQPPFFSP